MPCPRKVLAPAAEPAGVENPVGNGLLRVLAGVALLFVLTINGVDALKPSLLLIAFEDVTPVEAMLCRVSGCTKIPKPPRNTDLVSGLKEKPTRGLKKPLFVVYTAPLLADGNVSPPSVLIVEPTMAFGVVVYFAAAAAEVVLGAVGLNPLTVLPSFSSNGVSISKRRPRLIVSLSLMRQSSCTKDPM